MKRLMIKAIYHTVMALPYTVVDGLAKPHYPRLHKAGVSMIYKLDKDFSDG